MTNVIDRTSAADLFLLRVLDRARNGVINDLKFRLAQGPPGRKPPSTVTALSDWFRRLSSEDQTRVAEIIRESVDSALFGVLVVLDGLSGGAPNPQVASDFALSLQMYSNEQARDDNAPEISVRINPANTTEPLHDLFRWKLQGS